MGYIVPVIAAITFFILIAGAMAYEVEDHTIISRDEAISGYSTSDFLMPDFQDVYDINLLAGDRITITLSMSTGDDLDRFFTFITGEQ